MSGRAPLGVRVAVRLAIVVLVIAFVWLTANLPLVAAGLLVVACVIDVAVDAHRRRVRQRPAS